MVATLFDIFEILLGSLGRNTRDIFQLFFLLAVAYTCFKHPEIITAIIAMITDEKIKEIMPIVSNLRFFH